MASFDMTAGNAVLKELYDGQDVSELTYSDHPFLALLKKNTDFEGKSKPIPVRIGTTVGRSATFATAQTNTSGSKAVSFQLTRAKDYALAMIDGETAMAAKSDKGAFVSAVKFETDGAFISISNSLSQSLFGAGTGSIGKNATATFSGAAGVITLSDPQSVVHFEVGQVLQAAATDGGSPRVALGYVIAVDRDAGTVTVSDTSAAGTAASPSGWAQNDFLLQQGDSNAKLKGLPAWIPVSAPGATLFFGVDRSVDTTRLGGVRYDGSAQSIAEALTDAVARLCREGGHPDVCITNFVSYSALEKELGAKVQYVDMKGNGQINFRGIQLATPNGVVSVLADRDCPGKIAYLLEMKSWALESAGDVPMVLEQDGNKMLRSATADAYEVRVGYYAQLRTDAPGHNAVVSLGA